MFRRYTTKYYYTFQEVMNNAYPYQAEGDNLDWYSMLKFFLPNAPLYKETGEYDDRNKLDIQQFVHQTLKVKSGEMFDVVRV